MLRRSVPSVFRKLRYLSTSTVNEQEVQKFSALAKEWWNPNGPMCALHDMNPIRLSYIREKAAAHLNLPKDSPVPFKALDALDLGCGAGILTEAIARLGASVVGVDATNEVIEVAKLHSTRDPVVEKNVRYMCTTAEDLVKEDRHFDIICSMEVVEHVNDLPGFLDSASKLLRPGGSLFLSTINRTPSSYAAAIIMAEHIFGLAPKGTHEWNKFVKPDELVALLTHSKLTFESIQGVLYNPLGRKWMYTSSVDVNYMMHATKPVI
eukprot:GILK01007053.1.p1 GENE.GILK01007053.1~~GILK01007053.1.p1  ORF type:complete len:265 (+),score=34.17 GILK01007053.1:59-853(+)